MSRMDLAVRCCVLGGAVQVIAGVVAASVPALGMEADPVAVWLVLLALLHASQLIGVLGLWWSGRVGAGRPARIGLCAAVCGVALFIPGELVYLFSQATSDALFAIGTPLAGVGLVVAGVGVLRVVSPVTGLGRFTPLLTGAYVFVVLLPAFALGPVGAVLAIGGWGVCWVLLGLWLRPVRSPASAVAVPSVAR